jgi:Major capsid protein N-terminus/Large eukaryotic DNA virus major capsid protein
MTGSLLQLQAHGRENVLLTENPEINVFKYNYFRHINFSTEICQINLTETATFGRKASCKILKKGHLLSKLYLQLLLPPLEKVDGSYLSWVDTIGYSIFNEPIELLVDGIVVERLYPNFMDVWDELSTPSSKRIGRNLMIGKSDMFRSNVYNGLTQTTLMIPLEFWFTKEYAMALPLLSLNTDDIKLNFSFKSFSECINYDGTSIPNSINILDSYVYAEYIWIDEPFIDIFKSTEHFYVINQSEYHGNEIVSSNVTNYTTHLKFSNPSKELFITCVDTANIVTNNYFNYSRPDGNPFISSLSMYLDGRLRFDNLPEFYYRCIFPDCVHTCIPDKYIYTLPFSLRPEDNQPTGCLSTSRFSDITINFNLTPGNPTFNLYIYSLIYNFLIIKNGKMYFEFAI